MNAPFTRNEYDEMVKWFSELLTKPSCSFETQHMRIGNDVQQVVITIRHKKDIEEGATPAAP